MKKYVINILFLFSVFTANSQTVVKMNLPPQAKELLKVMVLFDEQVPEGMPVVLGLMGYSVTGGIEPYTYQWLQNGNVVGTGDVVIITPKKGDKFEMKATDKNKCYSTMAFSMKVISKIGGANQEKEAEYRISPTLVRNDIINITLPDADSPLRANVRIFDTKGAVWYQKYIAGSTVIACGLPAGTYFVSVQTDEFHKVEKIIVP